MCVYTNNHKELGMRGNRGKTKFFVSLAMGVLAVVLILGTGACTAEEGGAETIEDIQGTGDEAVAGTEEEVVAETEAEMTTTGLSMSTDKEVYSSGEAVTVLFTIDETISADAFVGMVAAGNAPESVEAADYLVTEKIDGTVSGELLFTAPAEAGEYELRLVDGDEIVLAISFVVE